MRKELYDNCIKALQAGDYGLGLDFIRHIYRENHDEGRLMAKKFRTSMKKVVRRGGDVGKLAWGLIYESYVMSARDYFDDFMTALEFFRPPERQFWQPRRAKLMQIADALQDLEDDKLDELFVSQPPRTGKLLADDTLVLTVKGWKKHGDLKVGDKVFSPSGKPVKVTYVHPKDHTTHTVTFSDGTQIKCHFRHEWQVHDRRFNRVRVLETQEMIGHLENGGTEHVRGHRYNFMIPLQKPIKGVKQELFVPPYTLGAWLGDGTNTKPRITCHPDDYAMIERVKADGYVQTKDYYHESAGTAHGYEFETKFRTDLRKYGMCHSHERTEKHIPWQYLCAPIEDRLQLLAGLLDTDGALVRKEKRYHFTTCEPRLRDDVAALVRTFGWRVSVTEYAPKADSRRIQAKNTYWTVCFNPTMEIPTVLERKHLTEFSKQRRLAIVSIEESEPEPGNCITVEGDGLYLASGRMIPTHNSTLALFFMVWVVCRDSERTNIYSSYSKDCTDTFFNGIVEIFTDDMTYALTDIFPTACIADKNAEKGFINIHRKKRLNTLVTRSISMGLNGLADASGYIVIDDIHSGIIEARNPDLLLQTWQVVNNNLLSRKKDATKFLWIGTRWSIYDAISQRLDLLQSSPELENRRYRVVNVPALNENDESNFDYPFGLGFSTLSYKETRAAFEKSDDFGSWLAQYMGMPIEVRGQVFSPESLRYYNGELPEEESDRVLMVVDPSWGGGDYVSGPVFFQYGEDLFLHDWIFTNKDKFISEPQIVESILRNAVQVCYVEGTRVTGTYAEELDKRLRDVGCRINLQRTTKHWASQSGKSQRIFDKAPEIISRVVFRDSKHREKPYQQAMQQLFSFTVESKVKHDDAADSLAMAMVMVAGRTYAKARAVRRIF